MRDKAAREIGEALGWSHEKSLAFVRKHHPEIVAMVDDQTTYDEVALSFAIIASEAPVQRCGIYLGDNDGTCPQLTCLRERGHGGLCDNVSDLDDDEYNRRRDARTEGT